MTEGVSARAGRAWAAMAALAVLMAADPAGRTGHADEPELEETALVKTASERGRDYRAENGRRDGVVTTRSGLQYEVLASGDGESPGRRDTVAVHYRGTFIDGRVFDSTRERGPARFRVNGVIAGWTEALQMMRVGDRWRLVIPPELAYGEDGAGDIIGANETLVFEVELVAIQ